MAGHYQDCARVTFLKMSQTVANSSAKVVADFVQPVEKKDEVATSHARFKRI
jgi:hypothetical protein